MGITHFEQKYTDYTRRGLSNNIFGRGFDSRRLHTMGSDKSCFRRIDRNRESTLNLCIANKKAKPTTDQSIRFALYFGKFFFIILKDKKH